MATISAYLTGEIWYMPLGLLLMTISSYVTRPVGRRVPLSPTAMTQ
jgi:hypothetical protein